MPGKRAWQSIPVLLPGESTWTEEPAGLQFMGSHDCWYAAAAAAKLLQMCPTVCDPTDSSVHGIVQARKLEQIAISSSRESSWTRVQTHVSYISCIGRWNINHLATWESPGKPRGKPPYFIYHFNFQRLVMSDWRYVFTNTLSQLILSHTLLKLYAMYIFYFQLLYCLCSFSSQSFILILLKNILGVFFPNDFFLCLTNLDTINLEFNSSDFPWQTSTTSCII